MLRINISSSHEYDPKMPLPAVPRKRQGFGAMRIAPLRGEPDVQSSARSHRSISSRMNSWTSFWERAAFFVTLKE